MQLCKGFLGEHIVLMLDGNWEKAAHLEVKSVIWSVYNIR